MRIRRLLSELNEEITKLEVENLLLKEKIGRLENRQENSEASPSIEKIQWVEIEPGKRLITKKELGKYLGMGVGTISNRLSNGTFPIRPRRIGRSVRFDMKEVLDYVETNKPFGEKDRNRNC
jgi:predicted DNA-binding transcriptional regulator AlpA